MISHLHTIRKTLCSLWPGVISRADIRRRCLVSLINNNSSCLAVATGQDCWGDFDQSLSMSWEDIASVCTLFSLWLSLHMDSLWFGMMRASVSLPSGKNKNISGFGRRGKRCSLNPPCMTFWHMITNLYNLQSGLNIVARITGCAAVCWETQAGSLWITRFHKCHECEALQNGWVVLQQCLLVPLLLWLLYCHWVC